MARAEPVMPENDCLKQLRSGKLAWIECHSAFATDASAQAELSRQTFDIVRGAACGGEIRVLRAALANALSSDGVLELDPQYVVCNITTNTDAAPQVTITLAPKIWFQGKRVIDVSPRISQISSLPEFVVAPLRSAAESGSVRSQLAKELNYFLERAIPK